MGQLNINKATLSDMENRVDLYEVAAMATDGATGSKETNWTNSRWAIQWGYFNSVPDLKTAILMAAIWTVGKGYTTDPETEVILDHIRGWGKDTFDDILFNMEVIKRVGGDSYAEIVRDPETDIIINLKPLDPSSIRIVVDNKGIIKRYEQISKLPNGKVEAKFEVEDILHFSHNRLADQIHGISDIDALEPIIKASEESFADIKKVMHRQAKPMIMFKLGTDDQVTIDAFVAKMDSATNKGENIYIPDDKNSVNYEVVQVNVSQIIMEWRNDIKNRFYRCLGLPQIVFGSSGSTESGGKIEYLAHEQIFEHNQRKVEKDLWNQLSFKIDLYPPTSLVENLQADEAKDAQGAIGLQPSDVQAGVGR